MNLKKALAILVLVCFCFSVKTVHAATKFWIGPNGGSFNNSSNWSTSSGGSATTTPPGVSDIATFDGGDTNDAAFDSAVNVSGINITAAYTGHVVQSNGIDVAVSTGNFTIAGGTYTGSTGQITVSGTFSQSGGTFTQSSATTTFKSNFTRTSGIFNANSATTTFDTSSGAISITTGGGSYFNNVFFVGITSASIVTLNDSFTVSGNLTISNENSLFGGDLTIESQSSLNPTVTINGDLDIVPIGTPNRYIYIGSPAVGYTAANVFSFNLLGNLNMTYNPSGAWAKLYSPVVFSGTGTQTIYKTSSLIDSHSIWSSTKPSGTLTVTGYGYYDTTDLLTWNGGTATSSSGVTYSTLKITGGTFVASSGTTTFKVGFTQTGGTFNANSGTTTFDAAANSVTITPGTSSFNNVVFTTTGAASGPIYLMGNLTTTGDVTMENQTTGTADLSIESQTSLNPTLTIGGNLYVPDTGVSRYLYIGGPSTVYTAANIFNIILNGNLSMTYNPGGAWVTFFPSLVFAGSGNQTIYKTAGNIDSHSIWSSTKSAGTLTVTNYGYRDTTDLLTWNGGTLLTGTGVYYGALKLTGGTFTAASGTTTFKVSFTQTGGTYNPNNGTTTFDAAANSVTITPGSSAFNNVAFTTTGAASGPIYIMGNLTTTGDVTMENQTTGTADLSIESQSSLNPTLTIGGNFYVPNTGTSRYLYIGSPSTAYSAANAFNMTLYGNVQMTYNPGGAWVTFFPSINFASSTMQTFSKVNGDIDSHSIWNASSTVNITSYGYRDTNDTITWAGGFLTSGNSLSFYKFTQTNGTSTFGSVDTFAGPVSVSNGSFTTGATTTFSNTTNFLSGTISVGATSTFSGAATFSGAMIAIGTSTTFASTASMSAGTVTLGNNCVFNGAVTVSGATVTPGSVITMGSTFTISSGSFTEGSSLSTFKGTFLKSGGTFTANGTTTFDANSGSMSVTTAGIAFNNVLVTNTGGSTGIVTLLDNMVVNGNLTFWEQSAAFLEFLSQSNINPTVTVQGDFSMPASAFNQYIYMGCTVTSGCTTNFSLDLKGNFSMTYAPTGGPFGELYTPVNFSGTGNQTITKTGSNVFPQSIWTSTKTSGSLTLNSFSGGSGGYDSFIWAGGSITAVANLVDSASTTISGGAFNASSATTTFQAGFTRTGGTYNASTGTTTFDANSGTISVKTGGTSFNSVVVTNTGGSTGIVTLLDNMSVGGNLVFQEQSAAFLEFLSQSNINPTVTVQGDFSMPASAFNQYIYMGCTATAGCTSNFSLDLKGNVLLNYAPTGGPIGEIYTPINFSGTGNQTITKTGVVTIFSPGAWTVNKSSGSVILASTISHPTTVTVNSGTLDLAGNSLTTTGAFTLNNGATLKLQGSETVTGPTFGSGSTTVMYYGSGSYSSLVASSSYDNLIFNGSGTWSISASTTVAGDLSIYAGTVRGNGNIINLGGNWKNNSSDFSGGTPTYFSSFTTPPTTAARNNFTGALGFQFKVSQTLYVNQLGRLYVAGNTQNHTVNLWNVDTSTKLAGVTVNAASTSDANGFKWGNIGTVTLVPGVNYAIAVDETNGGDTWKDDWSAASSISANFTNITDKFTASQGAMPTTNGVVGSGGIYDTGAMQWTASVQPAASVIMYGGDQNISGALGTTFYNLTKSVSATTTLTFPSAVITTISNNSTLSGVSGGLLKLRSDISGTKSQVNFSNSGTRTIQYVDVKDNNNTNAAAVLCLNNCTDSTNNTNWIFALTIVSGSASSITSTGATLNGTIQSTGGVDATEHGFAYSTSSSLTSGVSTTTLGAFTGTGSYTQSISSLSCNTTYYFRAYAVNVEGTWLGSIQSFTSGACAPTLATQAASAIGRNSATLNGSITTTGGADATQHGFDLSTDSTFATSNSTTTLGSFTATGSFNQIQATLVCGTTYYVRAYAINSGGTAFAGNQSFTTSVCQPPTLTVSAASNVSATAATLNGAVTDNGGIDVTDHGFVYGVDPMFVSSTATSSLGAFAGTGSYTYGVIGLTCNSIYYIRSYATNVAATAYAASTTLMTGSCPISVSAYQPTGGYGTTFTSGVGGGSAIGSSVAAISSTTTSNSDDGYPTTPANQSSNGKNGPRNTNALSKGNSNSSNGNGKRIGQLFDATSLTTESVSEALLDQIALDLQASTIATSTGIAINEIVTSAATNIKTEISEAGGGEGSKSYGFGGFATTFISVIGTVVGAGVAVGRVLVSDPTTQSTTRIVVTSAAALGVVIGSVGAAGQSFSVSDIALNINKMWGFFLTALGLRKRAAPWGIVYDSVNMQPVDPAILMVYDVQGNQVADAITDMEGRYGFLLEPGTYTITAGKTHYAFPSRRLAGKKSDGFRDHLYFGEKFTVKKMGDAITMNIPVDPVGFDWNEFIKREQHMTSFFSRHDRILKLFSDLLFIIGFALAVLSVAYYPSFSNIFLFGIYSVVMVVVVSSGRLRALGSLTDADGKRMAFARITVISEDRQSELTKKVADQYGRYFCLVPKGSYYVKVERQNMDGSYSDVYMTDLIRARRGIIRKRIRL